MDLIDVEVTISNTQKTTESLKPEKSIYIYVIIL